MRNRLVIMRVTAENALRSRLAMYGLPFKASHRPGGAREQVEALIAELSGYEQIDIRPEVAPLVDLCESLRTAVSKLNWDLEKRARSYEVCRLLMEVPGVGSISALSFYSAIEDPTRFERASDVAAYLGLTPRRYQSGQVSRTRGITKTGSKMTRTHLVNAAKVFGARAPDGALKDWYLSLRARAGPRRAHVALARKLAVILATIWRNGTHFEANPKRPPSRGRGLT